MGEHDEEIGDETMMQVTDLAGDPNLFDGWIGIPVHVIDNGKTHRHVELFFDQQTGLELCSMIGAALHMWLANEEAARLRLAKRFRDHEAGEMN